MKRLHIVGGGSEEVEDRTRSVAVLLDNTAFIRRKCYFHSGANLVARAQE